MVLDKIHILIALAAATAAVIISILEGASLSDMARLLIIVIVVFYTIGLFIRYYLKKNVFIEEAIEMEDETDEMDEMDESAEELNDIEEIEND